MVEVLRIYAEMVPLARWGEAGVAEGLAQLRAKLAEGPHGWRGSLELVVKVELGAAPDEALCHVARGVGLGVDRVWLWGQLPRAQGVFLNRWTWPQVFDGWACLLDDLEAREVAPQGLFFDLEPELSALEAVFRREPGAWERLRARNAAPGHERAVEGVAGRLAELRARTGAPILAACVPLSGFGAEAELAAERALGLPVHRGDGRSVWPELSVMVYTSFALPRLGLDRPSAWRAVGELGAWLAKAHVQQAARAGARGSVICGLCATGILGDEPIYPGPTAMLPLLRGAVAARPHALEVFELRGVLGDGAAKGDRWRADPARIDAWAAALREVLRA